MGHFRKLLQRSKKTPQVMPNTEMVHDGANPQRLASTIARRHRSLLLRAPSPTPLRPRQHLNSAHRTVSCTGVSLEGADAIAVSATTARNE